MRRLLFLTLLLAGCGGGGSGVVNSPPLPPPPPPPPAPVASITLNAADSSLVPGQQQAIAATLRSAGGTVLGGRAITWSSSISAVATVDNTGIVTAAAKGSASITAQSEGVSQSIPFTVDDGALIGTGGGQASAVGGNATIVIPPQAVGAQVAISIAPIASPPPGSGLIPGSAYELGPNGQTFAQPVTIKLKYELANLSLGAKPAWFRIAKLIGGTWTPVAGSTVDQPTRTVSAQTSSFSSYAIVEIPAPVNTVTLDPAQATLAVSETRQLQVTLKDVDGLVLLNRPVAWQSDATAVATVSLTGLVTAVATGTAHIKAQSEGKEATATITVANPLAGYSIKAAAGIPTVVPAGYEFQLQLFDPQNLQVTNGVTWTSSAPEKLAVSPTGWAQALSAGDADIRATLGTGQVEQRFTVNVGGTVLPSNSARIGFDPDDQFDVFTCAEAIEVEPSLAVQCQPPDGLIGVTTIGKTHKSPVAFQLLGPAVKPTDHFYFQWTIRAPCQGPCAFWNMEPIQLGSSSNTAIFPGGAIACITVVANAGLSPGLYTESSAGFWVATWDALPDFKISRSFRTFVYADNEDEGEGSCDPFALRSHRDR